MEIEVYTDESIEDREELADYVRSAVASELHAVGGHITGVEVHLSDENGKKRGADSKRCMLVVQLEGRQPMAVTHHGTTLGVAVEGACDRLIRMIESTRASLDGEMRRLTDPLVLNPT